jgi:hypothetical protein
MLKMSKILAPTKYQRPPKIHWFSTKYSSLYICSQASYQKVVKTQSDHHHCPISVFTLTFSKLEAVLEIQRYGLCSIHVGGGGGLLFSSWYEEGVWAGKLALVFTSHYTVSPSVSLSPISRSAGRPLSIKTGSRWSEQISLTLLVFRHPTRPNQRPLMRSTRAGQS